MKRIIIFFISIILLAGCKSLDKDKSPKLIESFVKQQTNDNIFIRARIKPDFPDMNQSFTANININALDSVSVQVFGPFGISIGRLYADRDKFIFFNTFENSLYKGTPKAENLKKVSGLDMNFNDLIKILRLAVPADLSKFRLDDSYRNDGKLLFSNISEIPEFILYSTVTGNIIQYQRKDAANQEKMTVFYEKYQDFDIGKKPSKAIIKLPESNGKITIDINEYKLDDSGENLSFSYPENIKVVNLDK